MEVIHVRKKSNNKSIQDIIEEKNRKFVEDNLALFHRIKTCRQQATLKYIYADRRKLYKYLSNVKILIITANSIEKDSLFSFASYKNPYISICKIGKNNIVYSFLKINNIPVVHVEATFTGSNTHGGSSATISEAIKMVQPSVVISLGVAFGANYKKNDVGDVLVGRQHFSYDKGTKVTDEHLLIKKLHVSEADNYMLSRFNTMISTEDKFTGLFANSFNVALGNMLTGEFVVDSVNIRELIFSPFQPFDIIGGEMESYGIYEATVEHDVHFIMIKGICDWAAGKNTKIQVDYSACEDSYKDCTPDNSGAEIRKAIRHNYKDDFQTLASFNACSVCWELLSDGNLFTDLHIKGFKKRFWRIPPLSLIAKMSICADDWRIR